jgi:tripartite-type tricarboxylate transporter receptor subunit TctC
VGSIKRPIKAFSAAGWIVVWLISFSPPASGQVYPNKPIMIYCGYEAGATLDVTIRALARGAETLLGSPVVVENKAGGGATICATLVAKKRPDGYTLGAIASAALTVQPHLVKVAFDPVKDFTFLCEYGSYIYGLCVRADSPIKTIDEFIAYARAHPNLSYGSPGTNNPPQIAVELLAQCKGLTFRHVPFKGGAPANTALLGKHLDFVAGAGQHLQYVKQGNFRLLLQLAAEKRDPSYPDIPTLLDLGCEDARPSKYMVIAPKGVPEDVSTKLDDTFRKVAASSDFQNLLRNLNVPSIYRNKSDMDRDIPADMAWYKDFLTKVKAKKE